MVVIIPHLDQELELQKFQKRLIKSISTDFPSCSSKLLYQVFPLWFSLPEDFSADSKKELKEISEKIQTVQLNNLKYKNRQIFLTFNLLFTDKRRYSSQVPFINFYRQKDDKETSEKNDDITDQLNCFLQKQTLPAKELKIFRLGKKVENGSNSCAIEDFVWHKNQK